MAALDPRRAGARCEMRTLAVLFVGIGGIAFSEDGARDAETLESVQSAVLALLEAYMFRSWNIVLG